VGHDPPSPRPAQGHEPLPPPQHPRAHVARPGVSYRRWRSGGSSPLLVQRRQSASRYQIGVPVSMLR
jgi:hypothetical protein